MNIATARGIGLLVVMAAFFMAGWNVNGWRLGQQHAEYRESAALALVTQQNLAQAQAEYHIAEMVMLDRRHTQEMADARAENDRLRADYVAGTRRVYVEAECPSTVPSETASSGMDDAGAAQLTGPAGHRYLDFRAAYREQRQQLMALQDYVFRVCLTSRSGG